MMLSEIHCVLTPIFFCCASFQDTKSDGERLRSSSQGTSYNQVGMRRKHPCSLFKELREIGNERHILEHSIPRVNITGFQRTITEKKGFVIPTKSKLK